MNIIKERAMRRSIALVVPVLLLLAGCAQPGSSPAGDATPPPYVQSNVCGTSAVGEPNPTIAGAETRVDALDVMINWYKADLGTQLQSGVQFPKEPPFPPEDPVRTEIKIRGLEAARDAVIKEDLSSEPNQNINVRGYVDDVMVSEVSIISHSGGGYIVDSFTTLGFTSDDPKCVSGSNSNDLTP